MERSSRVAPQSHRPANKQFFRATGWMFLADKRKANIEAAAWKDTQCELDVRRIRDREDSACKPVSSPARFDVGECAVVMRKHVKRDLAATMIFSGATG